MTSKPWMFVPDWDVLPFIFAVAYVVISALSFLFAFYVIYRVSRGVHRLWKGMQDVCGSDLRVTLIGLGIATMLFSSMLPPLVSSLLGFAVDIGSQLPLALMRGWQGAESCRASAPSGIREPSRCLIELAFGVGSAWGAVFRSATRLTSLPFADGIMWLASWALVGALVAPASKATTPAATESRGWAVALYARMASATRQNLVFYIILTIATYLSVAAIVAIPALREGGVPESLSVAKLREGLGRATYALPDFDNTFPEKVVAKDPFAVLEKRLNESPAADTRTASNQPTEAEVRAYMRELVNFGRQRRDEALTAWAQLRGAVRRRQTDLEITAISTFETESLGRKGTQETRQHFLAISSWFRGRIGAYYTLLNDCRAQIEALDQRWESAANGAAATLATGGRGFDVSLSTVAIEGSRIAATCRLPAGEALIPERSQLGAFYGPFGLIASWLLHTESRDLALITGLLGFGLLGSAVSTFVRERVKRRPGDPLVEDLTGVVIRGLSAAIVVFLAVVGGLAVFGSSSDPNPYVLLLTCLIGAVFSEDVWNWARRRLGDSLGEKGSPDAKPDAGAKVKDEVTDQTAKPDEPAK